jgi:hypothetical protein
MVSFAALVSMLQDHIQRDSNWETALVKGPVLPMLNWQLAVLQVHWVHLHAARFSSLKCLLICIVFCAE